MTLGNVHGLGCKKCMCTTMRKWYCNLQALEIPENFKRTPAVGKKNRGDVPSVLPHPPPRGKRKAAYLATGEQDLPSCCEGRLAGGGREGSAKGVVRTVSRRLARGGGWQTGFRMAVRAGGQAHPFSTCGCVGRSAKSFSSTSAQHPDGTHRRTERAGARPSTRTSTSVLGSGSPTGRKRRTVCRQSSCLRTDLGCKASRPEGTAMRCEYRGCPGSASNASMHRRSRKASCLGWACRSAAENKPDAQRQNTADRAVWQQEGGPGAVG